jgi:gamma-glutamyl:cysteine ligase YbdK (ATP-grasp superfamily)
MDASEQPLRLFQAFGIEIEYMVVDRASLDVRPIVDLLLRDASKLPGAEAEHDGDPEFPGSVRVGPLGWSNELTAHVAEFKTAEPARTLVGLSDIFAGSVAQMTDLARRHGCVLLPGGMHPWMQPDREMKLWSHDYSPVYSKFHEIFDCRGHGWSNLQSTHINLPFHIDEDTPASEFGRLHAAIRVLLPIMPALTASSPFREGAVTGFCDTRLDVYRTNSSRIPAATGRVIPERVFTRAEYEKQIFEPIYRQYEPFDREGLMRYEWTNSRGAIARFMRDAIEIRVLDCQECPSSDIGIAAAITQVVRSFTERSEADQREIRSLEVEPLYAIMIDVIRLGSSAIVRDPAFLRAMGLPESVKGLTAGELWAHLLESTFDSELATIWHAPIRTILEHGTLAERMLKRGGIEPGVAGEIPRGMLFDLTRELADCLVTNRRFTP